MSDNYAQDQSNPKEIIRQGKALLQQAKASLEENAKVYEQLGIDKEAVTRFTSSDQYPAESKKEVEEIKRDIEHTLAQIDADAKSSKAPKRRKARPTHSMI